MDLLILVPSNVTTINDSTFSNCTSLSTVTLEGVVDIGDSAFSRCSTLTDITLPNTLISIGSSAFNRISQDNIIIPISVTSIDINAFNNCNNLVIYCEASSKPSDWNNNWNPDNRPVVWGYYNPTTNLTFTLNDAQSGYLVSGNSNVKNLSKIVIPFEHNGKPVVQIANGAFNGYTQLEEIVIPYSIETIGVFTNVIDYKSPFQGSGLTSVVIPGSVKNWGLDIFRDCTDLAKITVEEGVTVLPGGFATNCTALNEVKLPSTLKTIAGSFVNVGLTELMLPDGLETISILAISGNNLRKIYIPASVITIDYPAIIDSTNVELRIYCKATSKPSGWVDNWTDCTNIIWNAEIEDYNKY